MNGVGKIIIETDTNFSDYIEYTQIKRVYMNNRSIVKTKQRKEKEGLYEILEEKVI